ncbi:hypothetical protein ACXIVK_00100 [Paraburkholderia caledonica]|jgi:hypothetical protein
MAQSGEVLYVYKCAACSHRGEQRLDNDLHDGEASTCAICGSAVTLEWDGGVTLETSKTVAEPVTLIEDARHYREQEALVAKDGVVVLFQGEVQGWVNQLRNPEHWQPGCVAVDAQGRTWTTIAGSERNGALTWLANHEL